MSLQKQNARSVGQNGTALTVHVLNKGIKKLLCVCAGVLCVIRE
ncbi:hypothetical protein CUS_5915 [Ruminococcus albus 8]|uniref:Uncharacterized protein n=1 Tax=Ruminococcus albus 8 TaxID=246199 RepID=E9SCK0_RUMAL|nr:hypothetical protein CUS_5915 [Ruminococcus albus 8]